MIIEVKKLLARKIYEGDFAFDYSPGQERLLLPMCRVDGVVKVRGDYEIGEDGAVSVRFTVAYTLKGQCSYCLEDAEKRVEFTSEVLFVRDREDLDNYYYDGGNVDLTCAVDDAFIISQPEVLLCKEGCGGVGLN